MFFCGAKIESESDPNKFLFEGHSGAWSLAGHDVALSKALEMARELRKMGEERALVLYKAGTIWEIQCPFWPAWLTLRAHPRASGVAALMHTPHV